jgi:hypothetical protein
MKMSFVIAPDRPLGNVADQGAATHIKRRDSHPKAFGFRRVEQSAARIGDKIGFAIDKAIDLFALSLGHEIVRLRVETILEFVIASEHERHVVQ